MNHKSWTLLSFAAILFSSVASATTLYTDFGAGQSYNSGFAAAIAGSATAGGYQAVAASFQTSATATLDSIDLPVDVFAGTASFTVEVTANSGGVPGTVLESYTLSSISLTSTIRTVTSVLHPTLSSGTTYWIVVLPGATNTGGEWDANSVGATGVDYSRDGGLTWTAESATTSPAFDVNGTVPEPASALLLLGGLGILGAFRRIRS